MDIRRVVRDFIMNVSSHGLRRIFYPVSSVTTAKYCRLLWFITWSLAAYYMARQMTNTIQAYLRYETVSQVTIRQKDRVPFPAVTVCSANPLRMSLVREWLRHCDQAEEARFLCLHYAHEMNELDKRYDRLNGTLFTKILHSLTLTNLMSENEDVLKTKVTDALNQTSTEDLLRQWNEIAKSRQKLGRALNWNLTRFHPRIAEKLSATVADILVDGGSFNGKKYDAKTMESYWKFNFHAATNRSPGGRNCYTFNMDGTLDQTQPDLEGGLIIYLAKNLSRSMEDCFETIPVQNQGGDCGGYLTMIHAPGTLPTMAHREVWFIDVSAALSYEFEERQNQRKPYGDCDNAYPREMLDQYEGIGRYQYSIKTCFAFKYHSDLPIPPSASSSSSENHQNVTCHSECHQRSFKVTGESGENFPNGFRLEVYNENLETKSVIQMPAVTFEQVVANAGGLAGLWLGASMLTVLELVEFVISLFHLAFRWIWIKQVLNGSVIQPVRRM